MAEYFGSLKGNKGETTRLGSKHSGMRAIAASWVGSIQVRLWTTEAGKHAYQVVLAPWKGTGPESRVLAEGVFEDEQ